MAGFATNGYTTLDVGGVTGEDKGRAIAVAGSGKLLLGGHASAFTNTDFALARYDAGGSLDTQFGGGDGYIIEPVSSGNDFAYDMQIDSQGRIVTAGYVTNGQTGQDFGIVRFLSDGSPDPDFGTDGAAWSSFTPGADRANGMAIQPDGKLILAGKSGSDFAVARYWP